MQVDGEANPLKFSQVFHLAATGGSFIITNGISLPLLYIWIDLSAKNNALIVALPAC